MTDAPVMSAFGINALAAAAEEWFGIKADPDDVKKLHAYIREKYNRVDRETVGRVFSSGEATGFLTVHETYFFREPVHFSMLRDLLPCHEKTGIRICSAAVASGCEAYSIAMLIETYNRSAEKPVAYSIDAFDINPGMVETARRGVYSPRSLRDDGSVFHYMADPYIRKLENEYQVDLSLKKNIVFFVHNLMNELPPKKYDIVFFRNAFIYFSQRSRERILSNLIAVMEEGGILVMGVSETAGVQHPGIEGRNTRTAAGGDVFYFQKTVPV